MSTYDGKRLSTIDFDFDIQVHKKRLTDLFFPNSSRAPIQRDSSDFPDFWKFAEKLQSFLLNQSNRSDFNHGSSRYDRVLRLNLQTRNYRLEDYMRHRMAEDTSHRRAILSDRNLFAMHLIFDMYLDFLMKQRWAKIKRLHRDRENLPIARFREPLLSELMRQQVLVIAGDTGCGKSTQVPQYLADAKKTEEEVLYKRIAVTQPRKIACISLAARVSTEMLREKGTKVGYQVRFERHKSKATQILFLTEGLLLRQMQSDPFLKEYDAIVLDEVHERHWQTDCLLGLMKCLVVARPEVRLILMSATINVNLFANFFNNCPILEVPGRLYPITLKYCPLTPAEQAASLERIDPAPYVRLLQHIDNTYSISERGDLLVFLSGMAEIQIVMEACKVYAEQTKRWIVLPLHSALPSFSQEKIFHTPPDGVRKCVLATNIAETSVTIDGIRFVADSGRVKELTWDAMSRMRRLKETAISKASADQRMGRAGRTGPGVCFRFFKEEEYNEFQPFTTPEIKRVPLDLLTLQMMAMGLPDVKRFPFIEPPETKSLDEALETLVSHGAATRWPEGNGGNGERIVITPLGRLLAELPVELSIGRVLVMASLFRLVEPMLTLATGMAVQSPVGAARSGESRLRQSEALRPFENDHGTPFMIADLFDEWLQIKSRSAARAGLLRREDLDEAAEDRQNASAQRWARRLGLEEQRLYEMVRLRGQFLQLLRDAGLYTTGDKSGDSATVGSSHRRLLQQARHREHLKGKRRRMLTLQDNDDAESGRDSDAEDSENEENGSLISASSISRLHSWLRGRKDGRRAGDLGPSLEGTGLSVHDLELVLCHDLEGLSHWADHHRRRTHGDLLLLKVVLAAGLYPQIAVPDPANAYRVANRGGAAGPGAEMVFHTPTKAFVVLQPNDVFVKQPDCLFPRNRDHEGLEGETTTSGKHPAPTSQPLRPVHKAIGNQFATDHQLLIYLDLLETTKPFLVNTIRVPALSTLLLNAREIDTNANATRLVFDRWIEIELLDPEAAQRSLAAAIWLRTSLDRLLQIKLEESQGRRLKGAEESGEDTLSEKRATDLPASSIVCSTRASKRASEWRHLQRLLCEHLAAFLGQQTSGLHTLRKLSAVDSKNLFCASSTDGNNHASPSFPSSESNVVRINPEKGGFQVTPFLTINSLRAFEQPKSKLSQNSGSEAEDGGDDDATTANLACLDLALRLHRQIALAQKAGRGGKPPHHSEAQTPKSEERGEDGGEFIEEDQDVDRCERCGKRLPIKPSATDLLRHKKHCKERAP
ncbi:ATP dependent RNA helicase DHX34 [Echinococcus multilocularis]|uniref:ATP dependent RNA helicase DHX34 n=1 Tax=Echinococcus multilocularis TaxID=6211 RepID=A0A068YGD4_ECHMU|nr:ATP dependent RNA helicase DHX34 [Echinococcus multilocularis]